jgi:hypothetical protein
MFMCHFCDELSFSPTLLLLVHTSDNSKYRRLKVSNTLAPSFITVQLVVATEFDEINIAKAVLTASP